MLTVQAPLELPSVKVLSAMATPEEILAAPEVKLFLTALADNADAEIAQGEYVEGSWHDI